MDMGILRLSGMYSGVRRNPGKGLRLDFLEKAAGADAGQDAFCPVFFC